MFHNTADGLNWIYQEVKMKMKEIQKENDLDAVRVGGEGLNPI